MIRVKFNSIQQNILSGCKVLSPVLGVVNRETFLVLPSVTFKSGGRQMYKQVTSIKCSILS